ncbi:hypothetical protein NHP21005_15140 [Helicobacter sp. NHP21005]|nr:hypothetical protein NHP21005_15140 [Helicobacter sp. NHP21005]
MFSLKLETSAFDALKADVAIVFIVDKDLSVALDPHLLQSHNYEGEGVFWDQKNEVLYVGVAKNDVHLFREAAFHAVRALKKCVKSAKIGLYTAKHSVHKHALEETMEAIFTGLQFGMYEFETYKEKKSKVHLQEVFVALGGDKHLKTLQKILDKSAIVVEHVNLARDLVNTPPMSPARPMSPRKPKI